ncbi:MAG: CPBP family intramembrane glutamic endopeptidase [bacterium]
MSYLRALREDVVRMVITNGDLIVYAVSAALALTVQRYHLPAMARIIAARLEPTVGPGIAAGLVPLVARLAGAALLTGASLGAIALVHRSPQSFGLATGRPRRWLVDAGIAFAVILPLVAWSASRPAFRQIYPSFAVMREGTGWFVAGLGTRLIYMFAWEFLFRGLLLFGFERRAGPAAAIATSTLPFVIMHFGKPAAEIYGSAVAGIALGVIALRGRSFLPCWLLHFAAAASLDVLTLLT